MSTIRAAVIGVGNMGTAHAACLSQGRVEGMTLAALCDVDAARRAELAEMFPGVPCYASVEELLAAGGADAAIVATPHPCHSDVAE
ncbi:MAG: Gfo/Idh/MocA family oxidoreductase, partial [Aristaeellaceae bacterium]